MPTYVYDLLDSRGQPTGRQFEHVQSMKDAPLTRHPETGQPCRRAIVAPAIASNASPIKSKGMLSNRNLERLGFTKYEKKGKGYMERTAGREGPRSISAED